MVDVIADSAHAQNIENECSKQVNKSNHKLKKAFRFWCGTLFLIL